LQCWKTDIALPYGIPLVRTKLENKKNTNLLGEVLKDLL
jgi:hypothetical protein